MKRTGMVGVLAALGIAAGLFPLLFSVTQRVYFNASQSAPRGWYWLLVEGSYRKGGYVLSRLPPDAARLAAERGYLPRGIPLLKHVAATCGDLVCTHGGLVIINARVRARLLVGDPKGRPLRSWSDCRRLIDGEVFLLSTESPSSFDSRYFGPVLASAILGHAIPLWTWQ